MSALRGSLEQVRLPWQIPLALALGALALLASPAAPGPASLTCIALAAIAPELAVGDLREHRLRNRMTLPALAASALAIAASGLAGGAWLIPAAAGAAFGGGMFVLALVGGVGMGDAKLAALVGFASPTALVAVTAPVLGLLLGGVAGVVSLLRPGDRATRRRIPLGPFLLTGWALALALSALLAGATGGSST